MSGAVTAVAVGGAALAAGVTTTAAVALGVAAGGLAYYNESRVADAYADANSEIADALSDAGTSENLTGSVADLSAKTGGTVGESEDEDARSTIRKKRLGTTALRIDPLSTSDNSSTSTGSGISVTPTTGLKI